MRVTTKLNKARHRHRTGVNCASKTTRFFWSQVSMKFPVRQIGLSKKRVSASGNLGNRYTTK